ncbi:MAG: helix-turn-helix domain-containing protein [Bacteroidales bacterium]|nr:helix-turn-helix domain-containing protein [Bacteroidales bacterium]
MKQYNEQNETLNFIKDFIPMDTIGDEFVIFGDISNLPIIDYPCKTDAIIFAVCLKGSAEISLNLKSITLRESNLLVISPEQIVQFIYKSDDFSVRCFAMTQNFIEGNINSFQNTVPIILHVINNPCTTLEKNELSTLLEYHSFIWMKIRAEQSPYKKEIVKGLLQALYHEIMTIILKHQPSKRVKKSRKEELFELFLNEILRNYNKNRSVAFYADKLCLTPKHLSSTIKEVTGKAASEWIDNFVILAAKAMLKTPNKTIQQIADELNFANQSFFGKYFKDQTGMSPSQYKSS